MFNTFEDILDYDKYFDKISERKTYVQDLYGQNIDYTFYKNIKTLKTSLSVTCTKKFYYEFLETINKHTFVKYTNIHITIDEEPSFLSFTLTFDNNKLSVLIHTIGSQGLHNRFLVLLKPFLLNLPICTNILNIRSETYHSCFAELTNLPPTLELLIIRKRHDVNFVNDIVKIPFMCEVILSDEL